MTRLLLTRPQEDSVLFAPLLSERGVEVVIEPMLEIIPAPVVPFSTDGIQALVVTSVNGARLLASYPVPRTLPVYAVGDSTAAAVRLSGFGSVFQAGGDVVSLGALIRRMADPQAGTLLHAAGKHVAGDLAGDLKEAGFTVDRVVLYEARPVETFSSSLVARLQADGAAAINGVLFFSPRTGATFARLVERHGLTDCTRHLTAFCLSAAVACQVEMLPWQKTWIAVRPERAAMLEIVTAAVEHDRVW